MAGKKRLSQTANKMREEIDGTWKPAKEKPDDGFWGGAGGEPAKLIWFPNGHKTPKKSGLFSSKSHLEDGRG